MTYLTGTDNGLAFIGSTKAGGIHSPWILHEQLAAGMTWGEAFRQWYMGEGKNDDEWYLGIIIGGDPLLTVSRTARAAVEPMHRRREWTAEERDALRQTMVRMARQVELGTHESYRNTHPQFFR
jgi:hypothetical protein